jgi:hypothetical protein
MNPYPEGWALAVQDAHEIWLKVESAGYRLDHRRFTQQSALNQLEDAIEKAERLVPLMIELRARLTVEMAINRMADVSCGD